jgi:Rad3-related DNA helicase
VTTPVDLGLPPKFASWRPGQEDLLDELLFTDHRFSLLSAPTGSGKSLVYVSLAYALGVRALVLVSTKGLQDQLLGDFPEMRDIRGQSNYPCLDQSSPVHEVGCDQGPCHVGVPCIFKMDGCHYYDAVAAARDARLVVTNYAYWMTAGRYSDPLSIGAFDLLVLDEAHAAPDLLAGFCTIDLDRFEVRSSTGLDMPAASDTLAVWSGWAEEAAAIARARYTSSKGMASTRDLLRLAALGRNLAELAKMDDDTTADWVIESTKRGVRFSPVWADPFAELYLFRSVPRVVLASATLSSGTAKYLGIENSTYLEAGSGFDPERRPFTYIPTTRVDRNMTEGQVRQWMNRIDNIIADRLDRKGIIHTRSYARARLIMERSRHHDILVGHSSSDARSVIERFKNSSEPMVLVSPSVETGYDFPGDECRFQIIAKVPFIDGRSPVIKARTSTDKHYLNYIAALSLVQMVGRGMRSADDRCETFILDDHWTWFRKAAEFPGWFRSSWRKQSQVPTPPVLS